MSYEKSDFRQTGNPIIENQRGIMFPDELLW